MEVTIYDEEEQTSAQLLGFGNKALGIEPMSAPKEPEPETKKSGSFWNKKKETD